MNVGRKLSTNSSHISAFVMNMQLGPLLNGTRKHQMCRPAYTFVRPDWCICHSHERMIAKIATDNISIF